VLVVIEQGNDEDPPAPPLSHRHLGFPWISAQVFSRLVGTLFCWIMFEPSCMGVAPYGIDFSRLKEF
jgi:hypothetical protein